jgi:hypothetical protein
VKTPKKKTHAARPATTPSATQAARARESLRRFVTANAHVPFFAALLAARPAPKLPEVAKPKPTKPRSGRRQTGSGG